ncbi:hypothetical protein DBR06_SOUSAS21610020, partial [Sousa chinensis]
QVPWGAIPHHPVPPKAGPGEPAHSPLLAMVLESPELSNSPQGSSGVILCELAGEAKRKQ